jgi:hypothetical protein
LTSQEVDAGVVEAVVTLDVRRLAKRLKYSVTLASAV